MSKLFGVINEFLSSAFVSNAFISRCDQYSRVGFYRAGFFNDLVKAFSDVEFRYSDGPLPNLLAISYALLGYALALACLVRGGMLFLPGMVLLCHSLVIAAYLIHECIHQSIFRVSGKGKVDPHQLLAGVLGWLTGACYGEYPVIRDKHLRHHFERADIVSVDYRDLLQRHTWLRKTIEFGQACYLPMVEILMHGLVIVRPFRKGVSNRQRLRMLMIVGVRAVYFYLLFLIGGWPILVAYVIAYLMFLTVLNFMDAFQHQYLLLEGLGHDRSQSPVRDESRFPADYFSRDYENSRTFSNLISDRWPVLNLLVLNFVYHSVHHQQPMTPWHRLPACHQQALAKGQSGIQTVGIARQLRDFSRYRVARVMAPATDQLSETNSGAAGVSFLTPL